MVPFAPIYAAALDQHGVAEVEARLPRPASVRTLKKIPDDRWLAMLTKRIFQAGFVWRVVEAKWAGFESAFLDFEPERLVLQPDEYYENLMSDEAIIRNWQKIATVMDNAEMILSVAEEHGSFAAFVAEWPTDNIVGLWQELKKRGSRLGGNTGPFALRSMGKDTFLLYRDVVNALIRAGVVDKNPTSQRDQRRVQEAFNQWHDETGHPLSVLSMILALSEG